jgi:hypothetical protein
MQELSGIAAFDYAIGECINSKQGEIGTLKFLTSEKGKTLNGNKLVLLGVTVIA